MKNHNEGEWQNRFKKDMAKMEDVYEPAIPEQYQLLNTLNEFKIKRKKAFIRELILFIATAFAILTSYIVFTFKMPPIFLWVQGLAFVFIPIILIAESRRRNKRDGVESNGF
ncbi:YxlC family protein [Bacillus sp. FJAT-49732]|uniref:YxlC family protein n=1 Tax=Lederbergia citrisecunda TaxID=2833583 RepID=A0A942TRV1_9BACI|nr:YxlC family protein [Lederbergia citrisecunda]MBS4200992.1 YxlC family protein [Lederbergia citrisecunda]